MSGGDNNGPSLLEFRNNSFHDIAINFNVPASIVIDEIADTVLPLFNSVALNLGHWQVGGYSIGNIRHGYRECWGLFPVKYYWGQINDIARRRLDSTDRRSTFTITLTELQRADAIHLSATPGGDGDPLVLDINGNGVQGQGIKRLPRACRRSHF